MSGRPIGSAKQAGHWRLVVKRLRVRKEIRARQMRARYLQSEGVAPIKDRRCLFLYCPHSSRISAVEEKVSVGPMDPPLIRPRTLSSGVIKS